MQAMFLSVVRILKLDRLIANKRELIGQDGSIGKRDGYER
jgi:hypothetical protein